MAVEDQPVLEEALHEELRALHGALLGLVEEPGGRRDAGDGFYGWGNPPSLFDPISRWKGWMDVVSCVVFPVLRVELITVSDDDQL